ncbi:MAG TPA: AMP-binding protein [Polyangia bacterium]|nr:AMP-binding protein [Polyangia bacterium]
MHDDARRATPLIAGRIEPPGFWRERSPFADEAGCFDFLAGARGDADAFWLAESHGLPWSLPPACAGGPGDWFPGGRLDPSGAILERWARAGDAAVPLSDGAGVDIGAIALAGEVGAMCARLARLGLEPGSRVLLALPRGPGLAVTLLACLRLGLVAVPIDPCGGDAGQMGRRARAAGCRGALVDEVAVPLAADLPVATPGAMGDAVGAFELPAAIAVGSMHPAVVFFDTAGRPYAVPVAGLLVQAVFAIEWLLRPLAGRPGRLWLETPVHHASFAAAALGALLHGIELVVPGPGAPATSFDQARRIAGSGAHYAILHGPQLAGAAPESRDGPFEPGSLELVIIEGDSVAPGALMMLRERGLGGVVHVTQAVARPELGGFVAGYEPGAVPVLPGCAGPALPGFDLAVVDQRNRRCEAGLGGFAALGRAVPGLALELAHQAPPVLLGLRARADRDGRLWPMGEGEVSRPETEHVSATEIEALVSEIEGVDQVAVVHYTDARGVTRVAMYLETNLGKAAAEAAREAIAAHFGPGSVPEAIRPVKRLPITRTGKLLRSVLRRVAAGDLDGLEQVYDPEVIDGLVVSAAGGKSEER